LLRYLGGSEEALARIVPDVVMSQVKETYSIPAGSLNWLESVLDGYKKAEAEFFERNKREPGNLGLIRHWELAHRYSANKIEKQGQKYWEWCGMMQLEISITSPQPIDINKDYIASA